MLHENKQSGMAIFKASFTHKYITLFAFSSSFSWTFLNPTLYFVSNINLYMIT